MVNKLDDTLVMGAPKKEVSEDLIVSKDFVLMKPDSISFDT